MLNKSPQPHKPLKSMTSKQPEAQRRKTKYPKRGTSVALYEIDFSGEAPPNHRDGVVHHARDDAEADNEHFDGKTTE